MSQLNNLELGGLRLRAFCMENKIVALAVFGSFANGTATEDSDLDLLVRFEGRVSLLDLVRVERELSELLGQKVDLVTEGSLSPYIRDAVLAQVEPVYEAAG